MIEDCFTTQKYKDNKDYFGFRIKIKNIFCSFHYWYIFHQTERFWVSIGSNESVVIVYRLYSIVLVCRSWIMTHNWVVYWNFNFNTNTNETKKSPNTKVQHWCSWSWLFSFCVSLRLSFYHKHICIQLCYTFSLQFSFTLTWVCQTVSVPLWHSDNNVEYCAGLCVFNDCFLLVLSIV